VVKRRALVWLMWFAIALGLAGAISLFADTRLASLERELASLSEAFARLELSVNQAPQTLISELQERVESLEERDDEVLAQIPLLRERIESCEELLATTARSDREETVATDEGTSAPELEEEGEAAPEPASATMGVLPADGTQVEAAAPITDLLCFGGCPRGPADEALGPVTVLVNEAFTVGYSDSWMNPFWVSYKVIPASNTVSHERPSRFTTDTRTEAQVSHDDYTGSGYDRGHLAPNATIDYCYGRDAQLETFLMTNVCPQDPSLNRGAWATLEATVRNLANERGELWVITGPIFWSLDSPRLASGVPIPDFLYKIVIEQTSEGPKPYIDVFSNVAAPGEPVTQPRTIDHIEALTMLDFMWDLPDDVEEALESQEAEHLWRERPQAPVETERVPPASTGAEGSGPPEWGEGTCAFVLGYVDARGECIEIRNTANHAQDLRGWSISDGEGTYRFSGSVVIQAGESHTVCMDVYNPTKYTRGLYLNNDDDEVYLRNPEGELCDEKHW